MTKVATSALTDAVLDWLVAKCEGADVGIISPGWVVKASCSVFGTRRLLCPLEEGGEFYSPSTIWEQGGPIIEREKIQVNPSISSDAWGAANPSKDQCVWVWAETPLIAAMRVYVASKLGDLIEIPEKLFE